MPATDDLHDTERTTEELAEVMFSGNVIEVFFDTLLTFRVSLSGVDVFVRHALNAEQIADLTAGVGHGEVRLAMPLAAQAGGPLVVDPGEAALLSRALEARNTLLGG
ncbi:hypothetical protein OG883_44735 [Streptomyces sp. NBC_01142]|uniref:hypothetical protein n=1 Tax=Streptomyces sp. NBC_01142 TaxID=2975865 RepID=UPI002254AE87|nr:hypothetical protein [Streptomyces sp. NBC_01142]MCX4826753.1 hypothetical protein [Streptomyces sp. NBC_01142]